MKKVLSMMFAGAVLSAASTAPAGAFPLPSDLQRAPQFTLVAEGCALWLVARTVGTVP